MDGLPSRPAWLMDTLVKPYWLGNQDWRRRIMGPASMEKGSFYFRRLFRVSHLAA
jgi:hypothetical protein